MNQIIAEYLKVARKAGGYTEGSMAERLGISRAAYMKYETGEQIPDLEMLCRIGEIFRVGRKEGKRSNPCRVAGMVEESKAQYGCQGEELSIEEYFALERCGEYELVEGRLVHRNAPGYEHQRIALLFSMSLEQYLQEHCSKCVVVPAPFCVVLDEERAVAVQPDISVICRRELIKDDICYGALDIAVEILSPATAEYDMFEKLALYRKYGVGEYWIVNPGERRVILYDLEADSAPVIASFETSVPSFRIKGFSLRLVEMI